MSVPGVSAKRSGTAESHARAVERVIHLMNERIEDPLTLRQMARIAYMSRFHFNRTFRRITGVPPRHFLGALRFETARRLLVTTSSSVTDVCFSVGYNSLGTFVRRFTTTLGISPRQLRQLATTQRPPQTARHVPIDATRARCAITGRVDAPPDFRGLIFLGLFVSPLPQEAPVACAILRTPGNYSINAPLGRYHLFAMALALPAEARGYLLYDKALRAGGQMVVVGADGVHGDMNLQLRPARPTDPPILLALPVLLQRAGALRFVRPVDGRETSPEMPA